MALFGSIAAVRAQAPPTPLFTLAFAYIEDLMQEDSSARARIRSIARGEAQKLDLGSGAFAIEQVYETKPRAEGFFESHRKFIDVQVIVEGEELMEVTDVSSIAVKQAYQEERDLITYHDAAHPSQLHLVAGHAAVFFPVDVHMPTVRMGSAASLVRKTVVKIPVT